MHSGCTGLAGGSIPDLRGAQIPEEDVQSDRLAARQGRIAAPRSASSARSGATRRGRKRKWFTRSIQRMLASWASPDKPAPSQPVTIPEIPTMEELKAKRPERRGCAPGAAQPHGGGGPGEGGRWFDRRRSARSCRCGGHYAGWQRAFSVWRARSGDSGACSRSHRRTGSHAEIPHAALESMPLTNAD